ncbi:MAG: HEAT repeat domain-containing protein [Anaerolineae bacterium]|jgi:CheY-like chemotaxis protein
MRTTFASFIKDRALLTALAYEMLNREWVKVASRAEVRAVASVLVDKPSSAFEDVSSADEFLGRVCAVGILSCKNDVMRWQSANTQFCLAASRLYRRYGERNLLDKEQAAAWLQERATRAHWHEPIVMMSYHIKNKEQAARIAVLLDEAAPSLATRYRKRLENGFFDLPWFERKFLGQIAWPLGGVPFWKNALKDWDSDTRRQAALVLGTARVTEAKEPLLGALGDGDDQVRAWAAWALGRLATVDALVPLLRDPSQRVRFQVRHALARQSQTPQVESPAPSKILVSDDNPDMLALYKSTLGKKGHTVLGAPGGDQALELAQREQPDLISTDILNVHMPGIELVFRLRNETTTRDTPILLASVHTRHWLGFFGGADAFIQVPFEPGELLALVDELLCTL